MLSYARLAQVAKHLRETTEDATSFYSKDVEVSSDIIQLLLDYQNSQSGFGLTTSRESSFTSDLVRSTSAIVDNKTSTYWQASRKRVAGLSAPDLVYTWQEYLSTLLKNADHIHLDRSTNILTPNVRFNLDTMDKISSG